VSDVNVRRIALKLVYWLAVLVVSLVIVFLLVLLFESLDDSSVEQGSGAATRAAASLRL
jgi:cell division septal protein FtsQ